MKLLLASIFLLFSFYPEAQTRDWWENNVNWDGSRHWSKYLIYSPAYFGPNALPVPEMGNGSADSIHSLSVTGDFHFSRGDNTRNIKMTARVCLAKNIVSLDLTYIPVEWFRVDHRTKSERKVFYQHYYDKVCGGDAYLNMVIQVLNRWRDNIHLALRVGYRFPASSALGSARYTDAPGYYFDLSAGKPVSADRAWKWTGMAGFYVWQTNADELRQNDAFLAGTGIEYNKKGWRLLVNGCGYFGYKENGDDPIVFRAAAERTLKRLTWLLRFQQGIQDFGYTSFETGARYLF